MWYVVFKYLKDTNCLFFDIKTECLNLSKFCKRELQNDNRIKIPDGIDINAFKKTLEYLQHHEGKELGHLE